MPELAEFTTFVRQTLKNPRQTGAIAPSSRRLARQMAGMAARLRGDGLVAELGPGTGRITGALLRAGIPQAKLHVVELNPEFARLLQGRHAGITVHARPAQAVAGILPEAPTVIVSGLPLLAMDEGTQSDIVSAAFDAMAPGGALIQFTYGPTAPVRDAICRDLDLQWNRLPRIWLNLPPAQVYVFRQA